MTSTVENIPFPGMPEPGPQPPPVLPAGITQRSAPCWEIPDEDEHFDDEGTAIELIEADEERYGTGPDAARPVRRSTPCWTATAACGLHLEGEEFPISHHLTADDALSDALAADWQVVDGALRCDNGEFCVARVPA